MHIIGTERTALVVVDMQNAFCHRDGSLSQMGKDTGMCEAAVEPCRSLVVAARQSDVPVIFSRNVYRRDYSDRGIMPHEIRPSLKGVSACVIGTWDAALVDELVPGEHDHVFDKNRTSAFYGTGMEAVLRNLDIRTLVVCGVTSSMCVESTVRDAGQRDYRTFVVSDAIGELDRQRHDGALVTMAYMFAHVVMVHEVLADWGMES